MEEKLFGFLENYITLSDEEKQAILSLNLFYTKKKDEILLKEGERSQEGYFVLEGCIRTYYIIDGEEKTTAFYTEMEGVTPHCVIENKPSNYFLSCVENSVLLIATPEMEKQIFEVFPKFESLCRILSEKQVAKQQIEFDNFKTSSPEQRYLNLLDKRPDLIQRVPQYQLASYLGITPQSLSRMRSRLQEKG